MLKMRSFRVKGWVPTIKARTPLPRLILDERMARNLAQQTVIIKGHRKGAKEEVVLRQSRRVSYFKTSIYITEAI